MMTPGVFTSLVPLIVDVVVDRHVTEHSTDYGTNALYCRLCLTSLKSVSSMKLRRDIKVSQKTAWCMLHRIREAWAFQTPGNFIGPVEADEAFFGGKVANMHK